MWIFSGGLLHIYEGIDLWIKARARKLRKKRVQNVPNARRTKKCMQALDKEGGGGGSLLSANTSPLFYVL